MTRVIPSFKAFFFQLTLSSRGTMSPRRLWVLRIVAVWWLLGVGRAFLGFLQNHTTLLWALLIVIGMGGWMMIAAEVLPRNSTMLAGILRIAAVPVILIGLIASLGYFALK
jgi:hypothetical protein